MKDIKEINELSDIIKKYIINQLEIKNSNDDNAIENWLTRAAHKAREISIATHACKFINPGIKKSTNINHKTKETCNNFISTSTLLHVVYDVIGNAGALYVYKFLQLSYEKKTILQRIMENDTSLYAALPGTEEQKKEWISAFAGITQTKDKPATHRLAKQVYFPAESNEYHILAPLFPTSLVQAVFEQVQTRFNENTKEARKARKNKKPYSQGYREYNNLTVKNFGGSNPQNISYLNSVRGGKNYLLPSVPPNFENKVTIPARNIFFQFRFLIKDLFLHVKKGDEDSVRKFFDLFVFYIQCLKQLKKGWSENENCKIPVYQKRLFDRLYTAEENEKGRIKFKKYFKNWAYARWKFNKSDFFDNEIDQVFEVI